MKSPCFLIAPAILLLVFTVGCNSGEHATAEPTELSLAEQVAAVRSGKSDRIQLEQTPLSDDDLQGMSELSNLRELLIDDVRSKVTAAGVKQLAALPKLEHLRIRGGGIDDAALAAIMELKSLHILNVPQATFGDDALVHLKSLPYLESFRFGSSQVSDAGMQTLRELPALKRLHLIDVPITDVGLADLAKIEQLESLYIDGAQLSDGAFDELFRQRPGLHVHINQEHHDRDPQAHKHP
jgi:hypothetical protein